MKDFELLKTQMKPGCLEAGIDEAGRGCLAGPVYVAAVILPENFQHKLLQDSKKLTEIQREEAYDIIKENALYYSVVSVASDIIDEINILEATMIGMNQVIHNLEKIPDHIIVDGNRFVWNNFVWKDKDWDFQFPTVDTVIHGDATYANIAAASILAKVSRDRYMCSVDEIYPEYNFKVNKGYGTEEHRNAIKKYGLTDIHRKTFNVK